MPAPPDISIMLLAAKKELVIVISPFTVNEPVVIATLEILPALLEVIVNIRLPVTVAVAVFTLSAWITLFVGWLIVTFPFTVKETPAASVKELAAALLVNVRPVQVALLFKVIVPVEIMIGGNVVATVPPMVFVVPVKVTLAAETGDALLFTQFPPTDKVEEGAVKLPSVLV